MPICKTHTLIIDGLQPIIPNYITGNTYTLALGK